MAVESLKVLRRRVRSVKNIKQITRAMEMVAASKLRRAQATLFAGRPYAAKIMELLAHLAESSDIASHPLFVPREGKRKILVLYTSDRGLCGSFNTNIIKRAEELLKSDPETRWELVCVGKRGNDYFRRRKWPIIETVLGLNGEANLAEAQRLAEFVVQRYISGETDSVWLLYQEYLSTVRCRPIIARYLSLTPEALGLAADGSKPSRQLHREVDYILEPSAREVFDSLLPRFLTSRIYINMAEATTSEHSARMVAMNNATNNCEELQDQLTLQLNNARQAAITKELLEIVSGADALKEG